MNTWPFRKTIFTCMAAVMLFAVVSVPGVPPVVNNAHAESGANNNGQQQVRDSVRKDSYASYLDKYKDAKRPDDEIIMKGTSFTKTDGMNPETIAEIGGISGPFIKTAETGTMEWEVVVKKAGLYHIAIRYYPIEGKSSSMERQLLIDGETPFFEARNLTFPRVWANEKDQIEKDNRGNELRPRQVERARWQETLLRDVEGYYDKPYTIYFAEGKHTLALASSREPMVIDYIKIFQEETLPSYKEMLGNYQAMGYKETRGQMIKMQGEAAAFKSSPTLYPIGDRASPATEPYDVSKIRMNTIGGYNWRVPGQSITWEINVPENGLYNIGLKSRQQLLRGVYSNRSLWIDNKISFEEMRKIPFYYNGNWQMNILGNKEEPFLYYLTKGKHEIKLEVSLGELAPLIRKVESSVLELNRMYRKILMVTGSVPDPFRDYNLDKQIPELSEVFKQQSELLYGVSDELFRLTGEKSDKTAILNKAAYQLKDLSDRPETIQKRLEQFKLNIGGLGTWILDVRQQPLEIDYLVVASPDVKMPEPEASWIRKVGHELSSFFYSFIENYDSIGNKSNSRQQSVTVWTGTGRDQAQVLKAMIDDTFTPLTGINVNLKLVNMSVLLPSTLAGEGPDVAMQLGNDVPVNYGMRKAAVDLSQLNDFHKVTQNFRESAMVPYRFQNAVYALPEQQTFSMLFYRKDILEELGLEPPQTWDDVHKMIPVLQKSHMEFALPIAQSTGVPVLEPNNAFSMLLYQNDGSFYKDEGKISDLDSKISMSAFKNWTEFYTNYKFPVKYDFATRFRTGEMPVGIQDYTLYNTLAVSAPEIKGLWDFIPVPGLKQNDGTIRRDVASGGTAALMLKQSHNKDQAWEFMKWWVSKDTQVRFGREMEGLMGAAARYPTANTEALKELPWPAKDYQHLEEQWKWVRGIPEVPGGYFTGRHLDNAFWEVINNGTNSSDALYDYVQEINYEIVLKRGEINLE